MRIEQKKRLGFWAPLSKGGSTTTTNQQFSPAEAAERAKVAGAASELYQRNAAAVKDTAYTGATPIGPSAATLAGQQTMLGTAGDLQGMTPQMQAAFSRGLNASDVANNPQLAAMVQQAMQTNTDQFQQSGGALESIRTGAQGAGYGSSRQAIAEGLATTGLAKANAGAATDIYGRAFLQGQQIEGSTLANAGQIQKNMLLPGTIQSAVGQQQEGYQADQAGYDAAVRDWNLNKEWAPLQNYANIVYGAGSSQSTQTTPSARTNPLMGAMGGAAMGASMSGGNPFATAGGALVGLLAS